MTLPIDDWNAGAAWVVVVLGGVVELVVDEREVVVVSAVAVVVGLLVVVVISDVVMVLDPVGGPELVVTVVVTDAKLQATSTREASMEAPDLITTFSVSATYRFVCSLTKRTHWAR